MLLQSSSLRYVLLLLLGIGLPLASGPVKAQVDVRPGLRVGVTSTTTGGGGSPEAMSRQAGLVAGGFVHVDLPGAFALQPELLYVQKGAKRSPEVGIPELESVVYELDYVELPLLVEARLPVLEASRFTPRLRVGPTVGVNVASDVEAERIGSDQRTALEDPKRMEIGLSVGLGGAYHLGGETVSVDVRYQRGLTDAFDGSSAFIRNQGVAVTAGFSF